MDGFRVDHLAKTLVTRTDRRRVLQGVGGAVALGLGGCLGLGGRLPSAAAQEATPEGGDPRRVSQTTLCAMSDRLPASQKRTFVGHPAWPAKALSGC